MNMHVGSELAQELHRQAVERRKRMALAAYKEALKPEPAPQPVPTFGSVFSFGHLLPRKRHTLDVQCYVAPIGPVRYRDILVVSSQPFLKHIPILKIISIVADTYGLRVDDIRSARRTRTVVRPRQEAMWLAKLHTLKSLPEIGKAFGGRDHTTVLHAVRKIEELIRDHEYRPLAAPHVERLARQYEEFSPLSIAAE